MIIPKYWAEARLQHKANGRQVTVRRFGWADESLATAQAHAEKRAQIALDAIVLGGEELQRREPKVPYNGAEGVPIREEILAEHGDVLITRNGYGAQCLNSPNVLFADVDCDSGSLERLGCIAGFLLSIGGFIWGLTANRGSVGAGIGIGIIGLLLGYVVILWLAKAVLFLTGGLRAWAMRRIERFSRRHPEWHLRVYTTPAGFRILAMHTTFDPASPQVGAYFKALGTDPLYARMCLNQHCFRARVSPKPWRMRTKDTKGTKAVGRLRPRPGVWPVKPEHLPARQQWVQEYEKQSASFASCKFHCRLGAETLHPAAVAVQELHDHLSQSSSDYPLA
jgi:hypothetical protein